MHVCGLMGCSSCAGVVWEGVFNGELVAVKMIRQGGWVQQLTRLRACRRGGHVTLYLPNYGRADLADQLRSTNSDDAEYLAILGL
jgi:hypothetical protein